MKTSASPSSIKNGLVGDDDINTNVMRLAEWA